MRKSPETTKLYEEVHSPAHYTSHPSGIECIDVTEDMPFNVGNAIKYLWRNNKKQPGTTDLEKALWYIQREIERPFVATQVRVNDADILKVANYENFNVGTGMTLLYIYSKTGNKNALHDAINTVKREIERLNAQASEAEAQKPSKKGRRR